MRKSIIVAYALLGMGAFATVAICAEDLAAAVSLPVIVFILTSLRGYRFSKNHGANDPSVRTWKMLLPSKLPPGVTP